MKPVTRAGALRTAELDNYGISLNMIKAETREPRLFLCVIRGVLVFMATFGTICGIASAFELDFDFVKVLFLHFLISMFICLIYYNKISFYVGYLLLLALFAWFSIKYFWYINSGFQAFLNVTGRKYANFFNLPAVRDATEVISDRYETITMLMIFLGVLFALLLNIAISAYMSLFLTFLVTFLPLQVAFYINRNIPLPYLMMILAVYISVMVLKRSGNYALPSKYGKEHIFAMKRTGLFGKKQKTVHKYLVNGTGMVWVAVIGIATAMTFMLVMNGMLKRTANTDEVTNVVKAKTDEYVKTIAQGGISALFNRYDSVGGLSRGQLGGVGSVSPDFQTDLIVRFVPYSADSIYLRSYLGKSYANNRFWPSFTPKERDSIVKTLDSSGNSVYEEGWCDDDYFPVLAGSRPEFSDSSEIVIPGEDTENEPMYIFSSDIDLTDPGTQYGWKNAGKIWIGNVGAEAAGEYLPYYSYNSTLNKNQNNMPFSNEWWHATKGYHSFGGSAGSNLIPAYFYDAYSMTDDEETIQGYGTDDMIEAYEGTFMPYSSASYYQPNPEVSRDYESYVYEKYLDVPEEIRGALGTVANEAGIDELAAEFIRIKDKYSDDDFSFYSEIMDKENGLSGSARAIALEILRNNLSRVQTLGNYTFMRELAQYLAVSSIDYGELMFWDEAKVEEEFGYIVNELRMSAKLYLELENVDASAMYWHDAYLLIADLFEKHKDTLLSGGYQYAASSYDYDDYQALQSLRLKILSKLRSFYRNEFSYTMSPGRPPNGRDVVEYFLTKRRRGYCAHFASSACLLLRSIGIPTRYVEGYVISPEDINQGTVIDTDTTSWKTGDYGYEESAVIEVEISDASAHAWIEVYIDGYGWIPYEMTPPSDEDTMFGGGLFGFLSGIVTGRQRQQSARNNAGTAQNDQDAQNGETTADRKSVLDGITFILIPLMWLAAIFVIVVAGVFATRKIIYLVKLRKLEKNGNYSEALLVRYRKLLKTMQAKKVVKTENPTVETVFDELKMFFTEMNAGQEKDGKAASESGKELPENCMELIETVNTAAFSDAGIDEARYTEALGKIRKIKKRI